MKIVETKDGLKNLHLWRTGLTYALQKGPLYRKEWTNLYFSLLPQPPDENEIHYLDVRKPLPFADNTFDAVYAMHVIEHLSPQEGLAFVKELKRVLKPGAICRLSTPDLEDIIRNYFECLTAGVADQSEKNLRNYHWAQLEVFDQLVRRKSGGEMIDAIKEGYFEEDYLKERYGDVYKEFHGKEAQQLQQEIEAQLKTEKTAVKQRSLLNKIKNKFRHRCYWQKLDKLHRHMNNDPRKTLETNKWMYDRFSLHLLMEGAGLMDYQQKDYKSSNIKNWERYQLDCSNFGDHAIEPSLYVEAKKP